MLSSFRAATSSSSRLTVSQSEEAVLCSNAARPALQDKGKGRATSPETIDSTFCFSEEEEQQERHRTAATNFGTDDSPQQRISPSDLLSTPKSIDSASRTTPASSLSDSASLRSPWGFNESKVVSIDLGDPFTFDSFTNQQQHFRTKATALGMRRRPYQSGATPISPPSKEDGRLSRIDRASIFSGLRSSVAYSPPPPSSNLLSNESMSSSSKRSFEEAISPVNSPLSIEGSTNNASLQESTSRGFTSSLSNSFEVLRGNQGASSSLASYPSQATRRRVPYKRRRAASFSPSLSEGGSSIRLDEAMQEDEVPNYPLDGNNNDNASRRNNAILDDVSQTWSTLQNSFADDGDDSVDNVDLPSSTTQLLRQWWVDTEEPLSSGSQSGSDRSTVAEMGSDQGVSEVQVDRNEATSSTVSVSGSLPGSHTVLRRLQLQEREEEEDVQLQDAPLAVGNDNDYHDQLMDVFRRMNRRSSQDSVRNGSRPPLRSTIMMRSTTQVSDLISGNSSSQVQEDTRDDGSDLGDIISSYLEPEDVARHRRPPPTMLPSARAITSERALARLSESSLSSRVSSLQAQNNATTFRELARRNQEVLQRYSNPESRVRPRHAGSPTISPYDSAEVGNQGQSSSFEAERNTGESTFHYRPPSSRRPGRGLSILSTAAQRETEADAPLWGEYLLSRGPRDQGLQNTTVDDSTPSDAVESSNSASLYLSRLSERLSSNTISSAASRRRVGALDSNGRLRGPTRRQNENWLGMSSGEELNNVEASSLFPHRRFLQSTPSLEEQERVMSTYRQMNFPDPESSIATATQHEPSGLVNHPPQLPSLRSRSPFELPFATGTEPSPTNNTDQLSADSNAGSSSWASLASARHISRPHLRPLRLSSRTGSSLSYRSPRHDTSLASSTLSDRRILPTFRLSNTELSPEDHSQRTSNRIESPALIPTELRGLFEATERNDTMMDHLDSLSSRRRRRRSQYDVEQREASSQADLESAASLHLSRRLSVHSLSANRTLRQRSSAGLHTRRRPTLLEADSSAVDMEVPNGDRYDLDSLMASTSETSLTRQEEQSSSTSTNRITPLTMSSSSRFASRRPLSRWDRYMEDVGTSIGIRSIMESQGQDQAFSSHSFFSSLSRLPGSTLASTLHSDIATNPANYVADDEFDLRNTYEGLLHLSAQIGDVRCKSTPDYVIAKLPTCLYTHWLGGSCKVTTLDRHSRNDRQGELDVMYSFNSRFTSDKGKSKAKENDQARNKESKDTSCSICLETYSALDTVMSLPCNHAFHENCLITWLKTARSCPCCRGDVCADESSNVKTIPSPLRILPELFF